jgi:hypothetical protein
MDRTGIRQIMANALATLKGSTPQIRELGKINGHDLFIASQDPSKMKERFKDYALAKRRKGLETVWLYTHRNSKPLYLARLSETDGGELDFEDLKLSTILDD